MLEYRCRQLVELVFNMSTILLYDTLQATPPLVDTAINEPLSQCAPLQHDRLLQLFHVLELSTMVYALLQCPTHGIIHRV